MIGSPDATLAEVGTALTLREEIAAFAQRTQRMDPGALRAAWRAWRRA